MKTEDEYCDPIFYDRMLGGYRWKTATNESPSDICWLTRRAAATELKQHVRSLCDALGESHG